MALYNLVRAYTDTIGTGSVVVGPAVQGYLDFSAVPNATVVSYGLHQGSQSEVGHGTWTSATKTLSRDTVLASTNAGAKIPLQNLGQGQNRAQVYITALKEDVPILSIPEGKTLTLTATDNYNLTVPASGTAALMGVANTKQDFKLSQVAPPAAPTVAVNATAGNLNGDYYYVITFVTATGETDGSLESALVSPSNQQVNLTFTVSSDSSVTQRKIYRTPANGFHRILYLAATIPNNTATTYTDNLIDGSLGVTLPRVNMTGGRLFNGAAPTMVTDLSSTVLGMGAYLNGTGYANTAIGISSLAANTIGIYDTGLGINALLSNTTGSYNFAAGVDSLHSNTVGESNTAVGTFSMNGNVDGNNNFAGGNYSLALNVSGNYNVALGNYALYSCTGTGNVGIGYSAGRYGVNTTGNFALGYNALCNNVTGGSNVAIGYNAGVGVSGQSFSNDILIGSGAGASLTTGCNSVAIGANALTTQAAAHGCVAIGHEALKNQSAGANSIAIGYMAGTHQTTTGKRLFIDALDRGSEANEQTMSLIYGEFDSTVANNAIQFNAGWIGFFGHGTGQKPTVSGSRGANAALASLLTGLASLGLITDSSS